MSHFQEAYVLSAIRTPVGKNRQGFAHTRPDTLLAKVLHALSQNLPFAANDINDVIIGCAMPEAEQGMNVARIGSLLSGLPDSVPAVTVNRFCSSGVQTIAFGAEQIWAGAADIIIAGGVESMSMVPLGGHNLSANPEYFESPHNRTIAYGMGITAEIVAERWGISREMQDNFALQSHQRALAAQARGDFKAEILPIDTISNYPDLSNGKILTKERLISQDEGPRADTSLQVLGKLLTVFKRNGTVTAGNSSQISDGAGAVILVSERIVKQYQLQPMARFVSFDVAGVPPEVMGIGPKEALPRALNKAGIKQEDLAWIELNEAFAAQSLAVMKDLNLDPAKVNPCGGAIALGHPLGATGAIRTATLLHGLERQKQRYGAVTMCIGTGMGAAAIFENLRC